MIVIVPYDPLWPAAFVTEAALIRQSFGDVALRIEHVGSTSIPDLAAKPVIDIQVSVPSFVELNCYRRNLTGLGYTHVSLGDFDRVYPFFRKPIDRPGTHHLHLCVAGSDQERDHLAFRDYLRLHPRVAADYVVLKRALAAMHDGLTLESQERYSLSKTEFVRFVLSRALAEPQGVEGRGNV